MRQVQIHTHTHTYTSCSLSAVWKGCWPPAALLAAKSEGTIKFQHVLAASPMTQEVFSIRLTHQTPATHTIHPHPPACSLCRQILWILAYVPLLLAKGICVVQKSISRFTSVSFSLPRFLLRFKDAALCDSTERNCLAIPQHFVSDY